MVAKFYPYGALMINRGNRILVVFHNLFIITFWFKTLFNFYFISIHYI